MLIKVYKQRKKSINPPVFLRKCGLVICFSLLLVACFSLVAHAEEEFGEVSDWLARLQAILPDAIREDVSLSDMEDATNLVGIPYLVSLIYDSLMGRAPHFFGLFASLAGLALLGGIGAILCDGLTIEGAKKSVQVTVSVGLALTVYHCVEGALSRGFSAVEDMTAFTSALVPIMGSVYVAGGNYTTAATQAGGMALMMSQISNLFQWLLMPLLSACFAFALLGALGTGVDTSSLAKSMKQIFLTVTGLMATIFSASMALQTTLSASADGVAMKTAKYALGQMIPSVGSTVSGTLSTMAASLGLVKSSIGVGSVGILLTMLIPPLAELFLYQLSLSLAGAFSGLLGFREGERLFLAFKGIFDMALGMVSMTAVMLLLSVGVFMKTTLAVG